MPGEEDTCPITCMEGRNSSRTTNDESYSLIYEDVTITRPTHNLRSIVKQPAVTDMIGLSLACLFVHVFVHGGIGHHPTSTMG
jgi:hypothetical protein